MKHIGVIGVGGVGGYFGGKIAQVQEEISGIQVHFIARNEHLRAIQKHGLILDTEEGEMICRPASVTDSIGDLPALDLCLVCVKSYSLETILPLLRPKIHSTTVILPLLNGVDIYERIRQVIPDGIVFPACVYVGTHIEEPGRVKQRGGACTIHFGKDPRYDYSDPEIFDLLQKAGINYVWYDDPYPEIWSKFIFIAAFGLVTARYDRTIGEVLESEELRENARKIMLEIYEIAKAKKINLPETIIEDSLNKGRKFPFETKTSFQRDFEKKDKPDERDIFGGAVIRMGEALGVDTPAAEEICQILDTQKSL